jgi:hypothetical protein
MAQRRMIDKRISVSEQVANLPIEAQLLFTWMIPHADDLGLLPFSARTIKALVVPMIDYLTTDSVALQLETMRKEGLIAKFEWKGDVFWRIKRFSDSQTLKKDRKPQTIAKDIEDWDTVDSILETENSTLEDIGNPSEVTGSKDKKKEEKEERTPSEFPTPLESKKNSSVESLTDEACRLIAEQYQVELKPVIQLREALILYCKSKGKRFKDYKATLQNWVRRGLEEKKIHKVIKQPAHMAHDLPNPITPEKWVELKKKYYPKIGRPL